MLKSVPVRFVWEKIIRPFRFIWKRTPYLTLSTRYQDEETHEPYGTTFGLIPNASIPIIEPPKGSSRTHARGILLSVVSKNPTVDLDFKFAFSISDGSWKPAKIFRSSPQVQIDMFNAGIIPVVTYVDSRGFRVKFNGAEQDRKISFVTPQFSLHVTGQEQPLSILERGVDSLKSVLYTIGFIFAPFVMFKRTKQYAETWIPSYPNALSAAILSGALLAICIMVYLSRPLDR